MISFADQWRVISEARKEVPVDVERIPGSWESYTRKLISHMKYQVCLNAGEISS